MAHIHICVAQTVRIAEILGDIKKREQGTACVAFLDYKMKLEPMRHHEYTAQFFENCEMSWHGSGIFYRYDVEHTDGLDSSGNVIHSKYK